MDQRLDGDWLVIHCVAAAVDANHRTFAKRVVVGYRIKTEGCSRVVDEWKLRPGDCDNGPGYNPGDRKARSLPSVLLLFSSLLLRAKLYVRTATPPL
jgi:hypothetical protein